MTTPGLRFLLRDVDEVDVREEYAFDVFEPKVVIEVEGRNVFEAFGRRDSGPVVIMDFLVEAVEETLRMLQGLDRGAEEGSHELELTASLFVITVRRRRNEMEIVLSDEGQDPIVSLVVGRTTVQDWVRGITTLAKELFDLFRRLNPPLLARLSESENSVRSLDDWLDTRSR